MTWLARQSWPPTSRTAACSRWHTALSLRSAMTIFFKLKNLATCAHFCRRLLELNPGQKVGPGGVGDKCAKVVNKVSGTAGLFQLIQCLAIGDEWSKCAALLSKLAAAACLGGYMEPGKSVATSAVARNQPWFRHEAQHSRGLADDGSTGHTSYAVSLVMPSGVQESCL